MKPLYLDNAATTRMRKEVVDAMLPYFTEKYGNASSQHALGEESLNAMNEARKFLAREINCKPEEIIFTSGTTESNNLILQGLARANSKKNKIIISAIEHPSIYEVAEFLATRGFDIIKIPVNEKGITNSEVIENAISKNKNNVLLVSIMHVNNIFGTIQDIEKIGEICKKNNVIFHTDAAQSFGKLKIDVQKMNLSALSAGAHKINGPKGIGLLYLKKGIEISPLFYGGGQEKNLRSGTKNVPAIVGFAKSLELTKKVNKEKILKVRNKFFSELEKIGGKINGDKEKRIYNNVHVSFPGIDGETLVQFLSQKGIYVSTGSACESKKENSDYVLRALGLNTKEQKGSLRISLSEEISENDVNFVVKEIKNALGKLNFKNN